MMNAGVMSHTWLSHVTHMNESCHTYISHDTHMNEALIWTRHVHITATRKGHQSLLWWMKESCHIHECVMSHIRMSHVTQVDESCTLQCHTRRASISSTLFSAVLATILLRCVPLYLRLYLRLCLCPRLRLLLRMHMRTRMHMCMHVSMKKGKIWSK